MNDTIPNIDIHPDHWQIVRDILQKWVPDHEVWAFGSRAKWTAKAFSDLDLAIITDQPLPLETRVSLNEAFSEFDLPWKVDVVDWASTSESFRNIIEWDKVVVQRGIGSEWPTVRLDQIAEINPSRRVQKRALVPFIEMAALPTWGRDIDRNMLSYRAAKGAGAHFQNGDTLLARITPCLENGKTAQVRCLDNDEVAEGSTEFIVLCGKHNADNDFIYYLCKDPTFREFSIGNMEGTSGRQRVSWSSLAGFTFSCLPEGIRRANASLLALLDDRIALLRKTNTTLEAIAQALFQSWFVDFDPVHARARGEKPESISEDVAKLFPDSFEESSLGLVPKGWKVSTLGDSCSYLNRGITPKYIEEGGVIVINQKCIRDFCVNISKARRHDASRRKINGRELTIGDVLVNSTGVGTLGRVAQVLDLPETSIVDTHVTVVRAGPSISWAYLGLALMRMQPEIEAMGEGSTGQTELSRSKLGEQKLLVPSFPVLQAFDNLIVPLRQKISCNDQQAQTLATLRDTLLPRLISGQLRIPEAMQIAGLTHHASKHLTDKTT